jgi:8-oxo-dGTP pyrophosphatase MutT (NUDIX family)
LERVVVSNRFLSNPHPQGGLFAGISDVPSVTLSGKLRAGVVVQDTASGGLLGCHPTGEPAGVYDLPKGQVDEGEDVREAAARELREETGIAVSPGGLVYVGRFPLRKGEIELFYVALPVKLASLHCDSLIDNPGTPERIGLPEMDGFVLLHRNDRRGFRWMGAIERLIQAAAPKFPRLSRVVSSSAGMQPWVVIYRGEDGELGWTKVRAGSVSEARKKGRAKGPVQLVLTVQGIKDILKGDHPEYVSVNEALFDFIRRIRLEPVGSSYSVGRGSASGQYSVVGNSGEVVAYQDSFEDAEEYAREANDSIPLKFPLSAIFRGYVQARESGYRGPVKQWMQEMGVEVLSSRRLSAFPALPVEESVRYEAGVIDSGFDGLDPINSATAKELLEANDNPDFYHRKDHLAATKAVGGSEVVRCFANTVELRTKSEHFKENKTYYRQWVLFKDFYTIARDKKIPFEDAVDYSLNYGDVHIRCSCPSHVYHGFAYMGDQLQYLYGLPREKRFPKIRNPGLKNATCFVAGTLVVAQQGLVAIESLCVGDVVLSHLGNWKPVVAIWNRTVEGSVVVQAGAERIQCTVDHPWFLLYDFSEEEACFDRADSLVPGDLLLTPRCQEWAGPVDLDEAVQVELSQGSYYAWPVQVAEDLSGPVMVYGIEVEGDHSYCVGEHGWAVKNCKHTHMALEEILGSKEKLIKMFSEYYRRLPSVPDNTMIAIPAPKEGGGVGAEPEVVEFEETGDVAVDLPGKSGSGSELEPEIISTEDPKSPGTVYVDTKLAEERLPEDQRFTYGGEEGFGGESVGGESSLPVAGEEVSEEDVQALADGIDEAAVSPRSDDERFSTEWAWQSARRF